MDWNSPHVVIIDAVVVSVVVTGVAHPVPVGVLLARVWHEHAVILKSQQNTSPNASQAFSVFETSFSDVSHLPAAAVAAREFDVGVSVNVCVLSTHVAIACPANTALAYTHVHGENGKAGTLAQLAVRHGSEVAAGQKAEVSVSPKFLRSRRRCRPSARRTQRCRDTG